jgi:phage terminase Nu1 subunit (DNA packaging protein)
MNTLTQFNVLRMAYDEAFESLCREMRLLKSYDGDGVGILHRRVKAAEAAYRQSRDELAQFLMDRQAGAEEEERRSPASYCCG